MRQCSHKILDVCCFFYVCVCFVLFFSIYEGDQLLLTQVCCFLSGKSPSRESKYIPLRVDSVVQGSKQEITKLVPFSIDVRKT